MFSKGTTTREKRQRLRNPTDSVGEPSSPKRKQKFDWEGRGGLAAASGYQRLRISSIHPPVRFRMECRASVATQIRWSRFHPQPHHRIRETSGIQANSNKTTDTKQLVTDWYTFSNFFKLITRLIITSKILTSARSSSRTLMTFLLIYSCQVCRMTTVDFIDAVRRECSLLDTG